jgi:hypothetical protein
MVAKEFGVVDTDNLSLALTSYLRKVTEHLAYCTLVLILRPIFFFQKFTKAKGSSICTTAHFPIDHLLQTINQPGMTMLDSLINNYLAVPYQAAVLIDWDCCVIVMSNSSCENTGSFLCSRYRCTQSRPYGNHSGNAKFTASLKLN